MNRKRWQYSKWYPPVVALLCLAVQITAAQGVVLCFGSHGHVAIKPAGHHPCDGTIHDHTQAPEPTHEELQHFAPEPCDPCVDIPLPLAPLDERPSAGTLKIVGVSPAGGPLAIDPDRLPVLAPFQAEFIPARRAPLRTVVLQV